MATKTNMDLDKLSAAELTQLIEEAKAQLEEKRDGARNALVAEMRSKAEQLGLRFEDLISAKPQTNVRKVRADAGKPAAVRYRGPNGETWSGRGRMPKWLTEAMHHGKSKEAFSI